MFINVANGPGPGLGALPRRVVRVGPRGMGAVVAVPMLVRRGPNPRSGLVVSRGYRGLRGLGDCTNLGTKYSNTPNGACRDNSTGSVIDCGAAACGAAAVAANGGGSTYTPVTAIVNNDPQLQPITVGGFTGDISVPTLLSALDDMLESKTGPPEINLLRAGADTQSGGLQDFSALAAEHCGEYPNSQGCDNPGPIVASVQNQWKAWLQSQASNLTPASSAGSSAGSAGSAGSGASAGSQAATATFTNLSRPSGYVVGDSWRIDLTGPPNSPVSVSATQNGTSLGTTPMGSTDANGRASLTGSFASGTVGNWRELFTIGSAPAPLLAFTVTAAAAPSGSPGAPAGGAGGGSGSGSGSGSGGSGSGGSTPSTSGASCYQFFGGANDACIGPVGQLTALAGGGILLGLLWLFGGKR